MQPKDQKPFHIFKLHNTKLLSITLMCLNFGTPQNNINFPFGTNEY